MCAVTCPVVELRKRPRRQHTENRRPRGSMVAAGPGAVAWPVARTGNRTENRTASGVFRSRTGGTG